MNADVDGYVTQLPAEGLKMVYILIHFLKKKPSYCFIENDNHISSADIIKLTGFDIIHFQETLMEELKRYQGLGKLPLLAF